MKMTRKRVTITAAIAALLTAGVFGGTYAKYVLQVDTTADSARVAKFHLAASELNLFAKTYQNEEDEGADIATADDKLIAPNFETTGTLTFNVTSEVKATLGLDSRTKVETNLPEEVQKDLQILIGDAAAPVYQGTVWHLNQTAGNGLTFAKIKDIPAHTIGAPITLPVKVSWALDNEKDEQETALAQSQYANEDPAGGYTLAITAGPVLTQVN